MTQYYFCSSFSDSSVAVTELPRKYQLHVALFKIIAFWDIMPCSLVDTCAAAIFREED
jgi:hypothetical protein